MKIICVTVLVLVLTASVYSDKCEVSKCPTDCEFGVTHEKQVQSNCKKCVCSPNPCLVSSRKSFYS
jgi:hypothetical protein